MPFDYTYLLKNYDAAFFNTAKGPTGEFIIPINKEVIGKKPQLFQVLHNSQNRFCFSITAELTQYDNKFIKEEIIQNLVRLLFLPNYLRLKGKCVFFIEKMEQKQKSLDLLKNDFYNELKKQGINEVIVEVLNSDSSLINASNEKSISIVHPELNNYLTNGDREKGFETFTSKFTCPTDFNRRWIVPVTNLIDFQHKTKLLERFERWLTLTKPFEVQLIKMYTLANRDNTTIRSDNELLKFKLENSAYYLQLIRHESQNYVSEVIRLRLEVQNLLSQGANPKPQFSVPAPNFTDSQEFMTQLQPNFVEEQNRANEILAFYKKEYEVLPMWYKKFGHIIKVLSGKRTFKSLFK